MVHDANNIHICQNVPMMVVEFWKVVETKTKDEEAVGELETGHSNREKKKSKEEQWELSLSDDSWYRAPQFSPMVRSPALVLTLFTV